MANEPAAWYAMQSGNEESQPTHVLPMAIEQIAYLAGAAGAGVVLLLLVLILRRLFRRPRQQPSPPVSSLDVAVAKLPAHGPPNESPRLECYGVPVRLAVLVLAPVGRSGHMPPADQLVNVVDLLLPGLVDVVSLHRPEVRFWPPQLSSQGFVHAFFHHCALPGDKGKGTPWCSVAGKFNAAGEHLLAGLVCCADRPIGLGQIAIAHEGQWNDVLRITR